ncbi:MAG: CoA-binding protein, partial [Candidatus Baldrarchaeia archaeon]
MLDFIFNAKSIAVIGASNRPGKIGFEIFRNIVEGGFQGKIYPINPKITELMGHTCYHTIKDVPDTVDLAVIVIPAPIVPEVLEQCGEKGVKGVIIISAGFSEVGNFELENKIVNIAKKYGMRIVGPNCAGIVNTHQNLFPTIEVRPPKGFIAFVSQSGALGGAILMKAKEEQFGISIFASYGNACDVNESDILEYLMEDENSKVAV